MKLNEWKHAWANECMNEHTMVWFTRQQIFGAFSWWQKEAQEVGLKKKKSHIHDISYLKPESCNLLY